jgi:hydroxymethylpyrimidine pyrophosphatase-like HAD family hydrolase
MTSDLDAHLRSLPPVRVLYTDFDGTLLGPDGSLLTAPDRRPSARAATALVDARAAGVTVVPVSGRRSWTLAVDARLLGLADFIAEAGTVLVRAGQPSYLFGATPADAGATPRQALERDGALAALLTAFAGDLRIFSPWDDGRVGEFLLHGAVDVERADQVLAAAGAEWACLVDNGRASGWPGREVHAYHLIPRGTGKANAVAADLAARDLDPRQAVAVGDSLEDLTMAAVVGTYVQVANGHGVLGGNAFPVPGAMGEGFADTVQAILAARP